MVIHDIKSCFIHIPKCGGIAITTAFIHKKNDKNFKFSHRNWQGGLQADFTKQKNGKTLYYNNIHATYDQLAVELPNYKYYTVIRNPLTRWESIYKHNCDNNFIVDWDIITWTERAIASLENGTYFGSIQNLHKFERSMVKMGSYHIMYLPAWVYYREPEVEVHRLEDQTIWNRLKLKKITAHISKTQIAPYNRDRVKEMIYNYFKKDFERWQMTE